MQALAKLLTKNLKFKNRKEKFASKDGDTVPGVVLGFSNTVANS
jgi:hypothetical protein